MPRPVPIGEANGITACTPKSSKRLANTTSLEIYGQTM